MTVICLVAGISFYLGTQFDLLKDEYRRLVVSQNLKKILKLKLVYSCGIPAPIAYIQSCSCFAADVQHAQI